jgi:hypothetical protein
MVVKCFPLFSYCRLFYLFIYSPPTHHQPTRAQLTLYDDLRGIGSSGNGRGNFTRCHRFSFLFSPTTTTTTATTGVLLLLYDLYTQK